MKSEIKSQIEKKLQSRIAHWKPAHGGCIADSIIVKMAEGSSFFVKLASGNLHHQILRSEVLGLKTLREVNAIGIPKVVAAEQGLLILEYVPASMPTKAFWQAFGEQLAQLHKTSNQKFGFQEDNYIGATPQINTWRQSWPEFFLQCRIMPQLRLAEQNGHSSQELSASILRLESKMDRLLAPAQEAPALLHGDLWSGNFLCGPSGKPFIFDPAVYYGHREADLAMTRLFGGFDALFYEAYQQTYPLQPGWESRENLYRLYHVLNHFNLFGQAYYSQALNLARSI